MCPAVPFTVKRVLQVSKVVRLEEVLNLLVPDLLWADSTDITGSFIVIYQYSFYFISSYSIADM